MARASRELTMLAESVSKTRSQRHHTRVLGLKGCEPWVGLLLGAPTGHPGIGRVEQAKDYCVQDG